MKEERKRRRGWKREGRNKGRKELWEGSRKEGVGVGRREGRKKGGERGRG